MKKVAIVRRNGLGDLLAAMPLVSLCKEKFPGCHLTLFVDLRNAPLIPYLKGIDETIVITPSRNKYFSLFKTAWSCRHLHFDLAISARPKPMQWTNLFLRLLNASKRLAVVSHAWHSRWIDEPRPYEPHVPRHQMVRSLRLLDPSLEEVPPGLYPALQVKPSRKFQQRSLLVSVTNVRLGSNLDPDKIARHLNLAHKNHAFQVVINCEPKDLARAKLVAENLHMHHEIVATQNFDEFIALLASVDASWTGDGGIMHLMAALNKPQLILFGKTELWEWAPLSKKAICLRHPENVNLIAESVIQQGVEELMHALSQS